MMSHTDLGVYGTTCQMQSYHVAFLLPWKSLCKHPRLSPRARRSRFPHMQPTMLLLHLPPTIPPLVRSAYWALKKSFHTLPCFWIAWLTRSQNIIATIWVALLLNCVRTFTWLQLRSLHILYMTPLSFYKCVCLSCSFTGAFLKPQHVAKWQFDEVTHHHSAVTQHCPLSIHYYKYAVYDDTEYVLFASLWVIFLFTKHFLHLCF